MRLCHSLLLAGSLLIATAASAQISPNDAMRTCKNEASSRMPNTPLAFISVQRGTNTGDGSYMINFRSQPPNRPGRSGFCIISQRGRVRNFQFDAPMTGGNPTGPTMNFGGQTPIEVMRSCKTAVSSRYPNVPLAFINIDNPRVNGGSMLSNFHVRAPNGLRADGSCDVFKNGRVNLNVR